MNSDGYVITQAIRDEAMRILADFHRPFTDEDRWRVENKVARASAPPASSSAPTEGGET